MTITSDTATNIDWIAIERAAKDDRHIPLTSDERAEAARHMHNAGYSDTPIARRLHTHNRNVTAWLAETNNPRETTETTHTTWRNRAACLDSDPELFFPVGNTGPAALQIEEAKAICRHCPVREQCLQWALETKQDAGIWGGLDEDERHLLRTGKKRRTTAEGHQPRPCGTRSAYRRHIRNGEPIDQACRNANAAFISSIRLSTRDRDVLEALAAGTEPKQIAGRLGIAHKTVTSHLLRLRTALDVQGNAHIVPAAQAAGLLAPEAVAA